ncbi:ABC transporter permease subunit [Demequina sp. TTPB684]|uniref:ABC transporter permease n=1 Tax=Demequina sp. TTPB684 TaxID=2881057 RepID=UPI001CF30E8C|nr:ABC transporter permease subunit [Demequina sp. TTPB684]MCB2412050.1 ABC transporter permease subunit [Demequina sp. TTPB684]
MTSTTAGSGEALARATRAGRPVLAALFWVAVWQIAALSVNKEFLLASPWSVVTRLGELAFTADFWATVGWSLARIAIGFVAAAVVGALLAALAVASRLVDVLVSPLIATIRSAPVVSFIILLLLWTDTSKLSAIVAFLMVLPVMYANVLEGIRHRDRSLLETARVFRVPFVRRFGAIDVPAVLPFFAAACRIGVGLAWKSGVAAEVIGVADGSIGEQLYQAKLFLSSEDLFAWTLVIVVLSMACEAAVLRLLRRVPGRLERSPA